MAVKDDSTLITKGDLKKFYNKILPYMGGNYVFNTLGTKDYYSEDEKVIGVLSASSATTSRSDMLSIIRTFAVSLICTFLK